MPDRLSQAFQRHAKMGLLAASVFPIPKDSVSGIALPAGISPSGQ